MLGNPLQLCSTSLNSSPAALVERLILASVQPVQGVTARVFSWIPSFLGQVAFGLLEGDTSRNSEALSVLLNSIFVTGW